jgi:hypothetical protein
MGLAKHTKNLPHLTIPHMTKSIMIKLLVKQSITVLFIDMWNLFFFSTHTPDPFGKLQPIPSNTEILATGELDHISLNTHLNSGIVMKCSFMLHLIF